MRKRATTTIIRIDFCYDLKMIARTYKTEGIILKRRNAGEADRVVTIFTRRYGKVVAIAKGVRKIHSRRAGSLEPATQAAIFFAKGKTFDVITQVELINSFSRARQNLERLTQVNQILEIIDLTTRENQEHGRVYEILVTTLTSLNQDGPKRQLLLNSIRQIIHELGFGLPEVASETALKQHLENIVERRLRSKKMLGS